jgi:hypothetical protein
MHDLELDDASIDCTIYVSIIVMSFFQSFPIITSLLFGRIKDPVGRFRDVLVIEILILHNTSHRFRGIMHKELDNQEEHQVQVVVTL